MRTLLPVVTFTIACAVLARGQEFDWKLLDKFAKNAKESSNITLDENAIKLGASMFGGSDDPDAKKFQEALKGIHSLVVRSYEYPKDGQYNKADLEPVRSHFRSPAWSKIVDVHGEDETTEIFLNSSGGKMGGLTILTSEPREVTFVYISGSITAEQIGALSGKLGIPDMNFSIGGKGSEGKPKKEEDRDIL